MVCEDGVAGTSAAAGEGGLLEVKRAGEGWRRRRRTRRRRRKGGGVRPRCVLSLLWGPPDRRRATTRSRPPRAHPGRTASRGPSPSSGAAPAPRMRRLGAEPPSERPARNAGAAVLFPPSLAPRSLVPPATIGGCRGGFGSGESTRPHRRRRAAPARGAASARRGLGQQLSPLGRLARAPRAHAAFCQGPAEPGGARQPGKQGGRAGAAAAAAGRPRAGPTSRESCRLLSSKWPAAFAAAPAARRRCWSRRGRCWACRLMPERRTCGPPTAARCSARTQARLLFVPLSSSPTRAKKQEELPAVS